MPVDAMSKKASGLTTVLLKLSYKQHPEAQQVMYSSTSRIFTDPSHPLYLTTRRRAASFDPNRLYFKLSWHPGSKKKAVVSSWAVRRVREALRQELQIRGYGMTGEALAQSTVSAGDRSQNLKQLAGTVNVKIAPDDRILKAGFEEVKAAASTVVNSIQNLQAKPSNEHSRGHRKKSERIPQKSGSLKGTGRSPSTRPTTVHRR